MNASDEDPRTWLAERGLWCGPTSYDDNAKAWLAKSGHYLKNPPPGCMVAIAVRPLIQGLFGPVPSDVALLGLALVGRPIARNLPQNGSWGELTRFALDAKLHADGPHGAGVASRVLEVVKIEFARRAGAAELISYHDRSRHTGCIYKKAGFRKDGVTRAGTRRGTWKSRKGRERAAQSESTSKRRWRWTVLGG